MNNIQTDDEISNEDLRFALKELDGYVDITEDDLKKIYALALKHAKERLARKVSVRDVMTKDVVTIKKSADCHTAAKLLSENKISGMPVVDDENHVIGMVTEADILYMAGMRRGHTFKDILRHIIGEPHPRSRNGNKVEDIMTSPAITTKLDTDIRDVAGILDEKRIKRLPVVDDENRLIGILSRANLIRHTGKG